MEKFKQLMKKPTRSKVTLYDLTKRLEDVKFLMTQNPSMDYFDKLELRRKQLECLIKERTQGCQQ